MRYSYEFKKHCVDLYRKGLWPETPDGVSNDTFRPKVRQWIRLEERFGPEALQPKRRNRNWTPDDKREISLIQRRGWKGCGKHHKSGFLCNYTVEEYIHYYNNERIQKKQNGCLR